jgi:hypothetical protein
MLNAEATAHSNIEAAATAEAGLADTMQAIGQSFGGLETEFERKRSPIRPVSFG